MLAITVYTQLGITPVLEPLKSWWVNPTFPFLEFSLPGCQNKFSGFFLTICTVCWLPQNLLSNHFRNLWRVGELIQLCLLPVVPLNCSCFGVFFFSQDEGYYIIYLTTSGKTASLTHQSQYMRGRNSPQLASLNTGITDLLSDSGNSYSYHKTKTECPVFLNIPLYSGTQHVECLLWDTGHTI
jgi:hypothetical protein